MNRRRLLTILAAVPAAFVAPRGIRTQNSTIRIGVAQPIECSSCHQRQSLEWVAPDEAKLLLTEYHGPECHGYPRNRVTRVTSWKELFEGEL